MRRRISRFMGPPLANSKGKLSLAGQKTEVTEVTEEAPRHHHPIIAKSTLSALKKEKRSGRGREEVGKGPRGGQGLDTEPPTKPSHRAQPQSSGAGPRGGEEEDKAWTQSWATEPRHRVQGRGQEEGKRRTRPGHKPGPQSPATQPSHTAHPATLFLIEPQQ